MSSRRFDTGALDTALERRRDSWEQERQQVVSQVVQWLERWAAVYGIRQAYVFESASGPGRFRPGADVDMAVEQIDSSAFFQAMAALSSELGRDVDLVELADCPFANKIRREGIPWMTSG